MLVGMVVPGCRMCCCGCTGLFLVLWCNPSPLLVWRENPTVGWVNFCTASGPHAQWLQHLGCSLARKRLMWSRCWCCSALHRSLSSGHSLLKT